MPECIGNYSIPTTNGNVQGADTPAGAGILNFLNIYVQLRKLDTKTENYQQNNEH